MTRGGGKKREWSEREEGIKRMSDTVPPSRIEGLTRHRIIHAKQRVTARRRDAHCTLGWHIDYTSGEHAHCTLGRHTYCTPR